MKFLKKKMMSAVLLVTILMFGSLAHALPIAEFRYVETNLNNGTWQYDYTLYNLADPVSDVGYNLWDAMIYFDSTAAYNGISSPAGWDNSNVGAGFTQITSTVPGIPADGGFDLAPGELLAGLSFTLDYRAANLAFDAYFSNPNDPNGFSLQYTGTTSPESTPVPEPSTILLLGAGLGGLVFYRKRAKRA